MEETLAQDPYVDNLQIFEQTNMHIRSILPEGHFACRGCGLCREGLDYDVVLSIVDLAITKIISLFLASALCELVEDIDLRLGTPVGGLDTAYYSRTGSIVISASSQGQGASGSRGRSASGPIRQGSLSPATKKRLSTVDEKSETWGSHG